MRWKGASQRNPEQLFALGYAACFRSGLLSVAQGRKLDASDSTVALDLHAPNLSRVDAEDLMRRAHALCPYANAMRGNVDVTLRVDGTELGGNNHEQNGTSGAA